MHIGIGLGITTANIRDTTAPQRWTIASSSDGLTVTLTDTETVAGGTDASQFTIGGARLNPTVTNAVSSGRRIILTLDAAIASTDSPTLAYTSGSDPITDLAGNHAPNFTAKAITNGSTVDMDPPILTAAIAPTGDALVLTANEALDETSVPGSGTVVLNNTDVQPTGTVVVDGTIVTYPLDGTIYSDATVITLDLTQDSNPIRDLAHNNAANLSGAAVTNGSEQVAPIALMSAVIPASGDRILWTYNKALDEGSVPAAGDFTNNTWAYYPVSSVSISGAVVTTMLGKTFGSGNLGVVASYTAGVNPIRDIAHNNAANIVSQDVTNNSTQNIVSIQEILEYDDVGVSYMYINTVYSFTNLVLLNPGAFSPSGTTATIVSGEAAGSYAGPDAINFVLSGPITEFGTAKLSYTPAVDSIVDTDGRVLTAFSNLLIGSDN